MSLYALAAGTLIAEPQRRAGAKAAFATGTLRIASDGEALLVSIIAFGAEGERLLDHRKGDALSVSGRAKLSNWTGRDGAEHHGLSLVAEQIASARPRPRATNRPRSETNGKAETRPFDDPVGDL